MGVVRLNVEEFNKRCKVSCVNTSVCKLCRRENTKLFLKGDRCFSDKCSYDRRPYPPGQHGQQRLKFSEFALQLREKQKAKRYYGVSEKQFRRYFGDADRAEGITGAELLKRLEARLDNVVYTLGFSASRREARQTVSHGLILVNGRKVNIPSYSVRKGDQISLTEGAKKLLRMEAAGKSAAQRNLPSWLEVDRAGFVGTVKDVPSRDEVSLPVEENMIVEYYSR